MLQSPDNAHGAISLCSNELQGAAEDEGGRHSQLGALADRHHGDHAHAEFSHNLDPKETFPGPVAGLSNRSALNSCPKAAVDTCSPSLR